MSLRVQLSLLFDDKAVYDGLVMPFKQSKELNSLIIRCLSAYYYNEDVRNMIEGDSYEQLNNEDVTSSQDICDNIRNILAMQSFMAQELQNTVEDGADEFNDILNNVNQKAEDYGVAKQTTDESGNANLRLEVKTPVSANMNNSNSADSINAFEQFMLQMMLRVFNSTGDTEGASIISTRLTGQSNEEVKDEQKTSMTEEVPQVSLAESTETEVSTDNSSNNEFTAEAESIKTNTDSSDESTTSAINTSQFNEGVDDSAEDASDALKDLLNSIF